MSTKVTHKDVENVFFPMFDKLLKIASYRYSKENLKDYILKFKVMTCLNYLADHACCDLLLVNQANPQDYDFEVYYETIKNKDQISQATYAKPIPKYLPMLTTIRNVNLPLNFEDPHLTKERQQSILRFMNGLDLNDNNLFNRLKIKIMIDEVLDELTIKFQHWLNTEDDNNGDD